MMRKDWTKSINRKLIDLSSNVHFDSVLNEQVKSLLPTLGYVNNYPDEHLLYESISDYYQVPISNLAIGFGATDLIERSIRSLEYNKIYIVDPAFEMVEVYCELNQKDYVKINIDELDSIKDLNGLLYIANPNGNNGKAINVSKYVNNFKYMLLDEVYADFSKEYSLLNKIPNNALVVKSISKSLGLAGFRIGFIAGNRELIGKIQHIRMNYITTSVTSKLVSELIKFTPDVVERMNETKRVLEAEFNLEHSHGNYVLFKEPNIYTETFGAKQVNGFYRMALTDLNTLYAYTSVKKDTK